MQTSVLADPGADALAVWMPLVEDENPLLADSRRLPFAGQLVPPAPSPWGILRTYRLRLRAVPESRSTLPICCEAVVLNIEP